MLFPKEEHEMQARTAAKGLVSGFFAYFFLVNVHAGPFGLDMGMPLDELRRHGVLTPGKLPNSFETRHLKNGHPDMEAYQFLVSPKTGLCKIQAFTKDVTTSAYGSEIRSRFAEFRDSMARKYGSPKIYDFLKSKSIWNEPNDWMMGLLKRERVLSAFWDAQQSPLPDNLAMISIEASASGSGKAYLALAYEFRNADQCIDEANERKNSTL